jgi:hypothetical protein
MNADHTVIVRYLKALRRLAIVSSIVRRSAMLAAVLLFGCSVIQAVFAVFPWIVLPVVWDTLLAGTAVGCAIIVFDLLFFHRPNLFTIAHDAENLSQLTHPWLSLSLELAGPNTTGSAELTSAVLEKGAEAVRQYRSIRPKSGILPSALLLLVSLALFFSTAVFLSPWCGRFWKMPFTYFTPVRATVQPGTVQAPSGTSFVVRLTPQGAFFPSCRLSYLSLDGSPKKSILLAADSTGAFSFPLDSVRRSLVYQFAIGSTSFPADTIGIVPRPILSRLLVCLTPPAYTGIKPASLPDGQGNFVVYPGTKAHFTLGAPHTLKKAFFISSRNDTIPLTVDEKSASGDITVSFRQSYTFALTDTFSQTSDSVPLFSIEVIPDAPPSVFIVKPGENRDCSPTMRETLYVEAIDDIWIRSFGLSARKNSDTAVPCFNREIPLSQGQQKMVRAALPLALSAFSLYPGDTLFYWAHACDNRSFCGRQCAGSDTFFFRVPTFSEIHERIAAEENYTEQALESAKKRRNDMQKSLDNLMRSSQGKQSLSWEQQQIVSDLKKGVAAEADSLDKAIESFKKAVDKLKQQDSAPADLLSKMDKVQQALMELRRQYGDSLLFSLPNKSDNVSLRDIRESLEKFKKALPDLAAQLENTLKFLQMLRRDQELARMAADADRLARLQQEASSSKDAEKCLSKQDNICNGIDSLLKNIDRNAEKTGDSSLFSKSQLPSLDKICPLQKNMRSSLSNKNMPDVGEQNEMTGALMSLSESLSDMQSSAMAKKLAKEREILLDIAHDGLSMSSWQQAIVRESMTPSKPAGEIAALEQELRSSLKKSMGKINGLAMAPPQSLLAIKKSFDNADASLLGACDLLSAGSGKIFSREPESGLNDIAKTALDALTQMGGTQSQGSGMSGMMSGLRRLSSKQAMLNSATNGLLRGLLGQNGEAGEREGKGSREGGQGKDGPGSGRAREQARAAQKAIADELDRLAEKYGKEAGGSLDKKARELEEEARRLAKMFDTPSQELRDRQDRFLSRLLETSLSQHKQDEGKEERVSQSAKNVFSSQRQDISAQAASYDFDTYYRLRQRAFSGNFPESYRFFIKNYFDSLGVLFIKEK